MHPVIVITFIALGVSSIWLFMLTRLKTADMDVKAIVSPLDTSDPEALEGRDYPSWEDRPKVEYEYASDLPEYMSRLQYTASTVYKVHIKLTVLMFAGAVVGAYLLGAGNALGWAVLLIFALLLITLLISHRIVSEFGFGGGPEEEIEYIGRAAFPKKVYQGDSNTLALRLQRAFDLAPVDKGPLRVYDVANDKIVFVRLQRIGGLDQFLEIRLLGAGVSVEGSRTLRRTAKVRRLTYHWSCRFPHSGLHTITLAFRLVTPEGNIELGDVQHQVKVVSLDHLTKRQVWAIGASLGLVSVALAVLEGLHKLIPW